MCVRVSLTNVIGGREVVIQKGRTPVSEPVYHAYMRSFRRGKDDIAINFMILPEFFDVAYTMAGNNNVLADFLVNVSASG